MEAALGLVEEGLTAIGGLFLRTSEDVGRQWLVELVQAW